MAVVIAKNDEDITRLMKRFRKSVIRSGVLSEVRKRRWFISDNEERRIAKKKAIRRQKRKSQTRKRY